MAVIGLVVDQPDVDANVKVNNLKPLWGKKVRLRAESDGIFSRG